ncbi:MAG: HYR domain-containing protein, partial [Bacteroidota bacterium]
MKSLFDFSLSNSFPIAATTLLILTCILCVHLVAYGQTGCTEYTVTGPTASGVSFDSGGTSVSLGDDAFTDVTLPFTFYYFGTAYTSVRISSNGYVRLGGTGDGLDTTSDAIPNLNAPDNMIAGVWDDLNPTAGGTIGYQTLGSGTNERFVIKYTDVPHFNNNAATVSFQIKLFETTNVIEIHSEIVDSDGGTRTQGIENIDGSFGYAASGRNNTNWANGPGSDDVVTFTPFAPNQSCNEAIEIALGSSIDGNTTCANGETLGTCGTTDGTGGALWYTISGNGSNYRASTCGNANFDTKIRVYSGSCVGLTCVGGNDDACSTQSQVDFCAQNGVTYYILVHGFSNNEGEFTLNVSDIGNTPPVITCPSNISIGTDPGVCTAVVTYPSIGTTDDCGPVNLTLFSGLASGSTFPLGITTNIWAAEDDNGQTASCSFSVTVTDDENPSITCPGTQFLTVSTGTCGQTATFPTPTASDNCTASPIILQTSGIASGGIFPVGTTLNTFQAFDAAGNSNSCSFTIAVTDDEVPTITCTSNVSVNSTPGQCDALVTVPTPSVSDNCSNYNVTLASIELQNTGDALTFTFPGTPTGATSNATLTVFTRGDVDLSSEFYAISGEGATFIGNTSNGTQCNTAYTSNSYSISQTNINNWAADGSITIIADAETAVNNICTEDDVYMTLSYAYNNLTLINNITGTSNATATYPVGTTQVLWTVTDDAGNTATCIQNITVSDNQPPSITCPSPIFVNTAANQCEATVSVPVPVVSDNCGSYSQTAAPQEITVTDPTFTFNFNSTPTNAIGNGTLTVYTRGDIDIAGAEQFTIIGEGNTNLGNTTPGTQCNTNYTSNTFTISNAQLNSWAANGNIDIIADALPGINSLCIQEDVYMTLTYNYEQVTYTNDFNGTDDASGIYPAGSTTVIWTAIDAYGNISTCAHSVVVSDNQDPAISCPSNISVNVTTGQCSAAVSYASPTFSDNCPGSTLTLMSGFASGSSFPVGTTTVLYRATDNTGNTQDCSFTVTVSDNEPPAINCPSNITQNVDSGQCDALVSVPSPTVTDNCGTFSQSLPIQDFPNNDPTFNFSFNSTPINATGNGTLTVFVRGDIDLNTEVFDIFGEGAVSIGTTNTGIQCNTAYLATSFTISSAQLNAWAANGSIVIVADAQPGVNANLCANEDIYMTLTYNYSPFNITNDFNGTADASGVYPVGSTTVIWTAIDAFGNTNTCSHTVTINDNEDPAITCPSNITVNNDAGLCSAVVTYSAPSGTDNCPGATTAQTAGQASGTAFPVGTTTNTFQVTDAAGNTADCSFTVTVNDNEDPA